MTDLLTVIVELRPFGAAIVPGLDELRQTLGLGPLGRVGEVHSVRLVLCSYEGLLQHQRNRIHTVRKRYARELYTLERQDLQLAAESSASSPPYTKGENP